MLGRPVILVLDVESTGPLKINAPGNYRVVPEENVSNTVIKTPSHEIIEIGIARVDPKTGETWKVLEKRFKP